MICHWHLVDKMILSFHHHHLSVDMIPFQILVVPPLNNYEMPLYHEQIAEKMSLWHQHHSDADVVIVPLPHSTSSSSFSFFYFSFSLNYLVRGVYPDSQASLKSRW